MCPLLVTSACYKCKLTGNDANELKQKKEMIVNKISDSLLELWKGRETASLCEKNQIQENNNMLLTYIALQIKEEKNTNFRAIFFNHCILHSVVLLWDVEGGRRRDKVHMIRSCICLEIVIV